MHVLILPHHLHTPVPGLFRFRDQVIFRFISQRC